jgi:hypothetical protein
MAEQRAFGANLNFPLNIATDDPVLSAQLQSLASGIRDAVGDYMYQPTDVPVIPFYGAAPGAVGNGTLQYVYRVRNGLCRVDFSLQLGGTTFLGGGAGPIKFALPPECPGIVNMASSGTALVFNAAGGGLFSGIVFVANPGPDLYIHLPQVPGVLTPAVPGAFVGGDFIGFTIDYPYQL